MWFLYILRCEDKSLYTGISTNPNRRLKEHKKGQGGNYTRSHKPVKIVYKAKLKSHSAALKRELEIKSWNRSKKIGLLKLKI